METLTATVSLSEILSANVRGFTAMLGMTHADLADRMGVARATISSKFAGRRNWQIDELQPLADALNTDVQTLLTPAPAWVARVQQNRPTGEIHQAGGVARSKGLEPPTF